MADSTPVSGELSRATPEVQKYRPRACQSCARSKMRCVWPSEPGATPCQRCAKIKAPCTLPEINPRRRRGPSTRVGQLEEKIDGIMSLLNASQQIQQNSPSSSGQTPPPPNHTTTTATPLSVPEQSSRNSIQQLLNPNVEATTTEASEGVMTSSSPPSYTAHAFHTNARLIPPAGLVPPASIAAGAAAAAAATTSAEQHHRVLDRPTTTTTAVVESVDIFRGFRVTFLEADRALNLYRSIYAPYFPFVNIPVMTSPYDLYDRAPFLFRTIVAVATPQGPAMQADFKLWFRDQVAEHVVRHNEARLEILQAILVHLAWGDYYFMLNTEATMLIQLAMGLVIDLGLNRWPSDFGKASFAMFKDAASSSYVGGGSSSSNKALPKWRNKQHTLEEMRAALGTFYVTSLCATLFRRHHPMNHNAYLAKCCASLAHVQEYDSDRLLVALVRMQQIVNRGADLVPYPDDDGEDDDDKSPPYTPVHMALNALQKEMEALVREQPADVECNALLWTHFHANLCRLYEPVLYLGSFSSRGHVDLGETTARTSALWQCLHAARDFFSAYLSIPPQNLICVPFQSTHLSFCLVTLVRLLFLGDDGKPEWNSALARQSVDFETICLRVGDLCDEADKIASSLGRRARYHPHEGDRGSVLGMYRDKIRWVRNWYSGRIRPGGGGGSTYSSTFSDKEGGGEMQPMEVDGPDPLLDESFWQALFDWGWNAASEGATAMAAAVQ